MDVWQLISHDLVCRAAIHSGVLRVGGEGQAEPWRHLRDAERACRRHVCITGGCSADKPALRPGTG